VSGGEDYLLAAAGCVSYIYGIEERVDPKNIKLIFQKKWGASIFSTVSDFIIHRYSIFSGLL
jgi:hypothetical protein